jgi:hypothetical protein
LPRCGKKKEWGRDWLKDKTLSYETNKFGGLNSQKGNYRRQFRVVGRACSSMIECLLLACTGSWVQFLVSQIIIIIILCSIVYSKFVRDYL